MMNKIRNDIKRIEMRRQIDLTASPEPIKLQKNKQLNDIEYEHTNNNHNNIESNMNVNANDDIQERKESGCNEEYYRELLCAKYGTKKEFAIDERVRFFEPSTAEKGHYIDRIGTIKSKLNELDYTIIDQHNHLSYTVGWHLILKYDDNAIPNNNEHNLSFHEEEEEEEEDNNDDDDDVVDEEDNNDKDGNVEYKAIKKGASTHCNHIAWREWENRYILECNKTYKHCNDMSVQQKCIEISCKLSKYTERMKNENDPNPPWRTMYSVNTRLNKLSA